MNVKLRYLRFSQQCCWRLEVLTAMLLKVCFSHNSVAEVVRLWHKCCWRFEDLTAVFLTVWGLTSLQCWWNFDFLTAVLLNVWVSHCSADGSCEVLTLVLLKVWGSHCSVAEGLRISLQCSWRFEISLQCSWRFEVSLQCWWNFDFLAVVLLNVWVSHCSADEVVRFSH